jgi:hypothetical protein
VVLIEGPSGIGKTRIIQELYAWLRAKEIAAAEAAGSADHSKQTAPFWPELDPAADTRDAQSGLYSRKVLGPNLELFQ